MAACLIVEFEKTNWHQAVNKYLSYEQLGFYNWHGKDASSAVPSIVCSFDDRVECGEDTSEDDAFSIVSQMYDK